MGIKSQIATLAVATAIATSASSVTAQERNAEVRDPIAIAVIDSGTDRIDFDDPNVRFVDLTPKAPDGSEFVRYDIAGKFQHGDIVASSFVREYRKLEPDRPIVIYGIDPFIRSKGQALTRFDMNAIERAAPMLKAAGVKVAIGAFGLANENAGDRIVSALGRQGVTLFAATPNEEHDAGIYPAASKGAVAVASIGSNTPFAKDRSMSTWVDFTINGTHDAAHGITSGGGSSYAVAHAAAYGAYVLDRNPGMDSSAMKDAIGSFGERTGTRWKGEQGKTVRIGTSDMIRSIRARYDIPVKSRDGIPIAPDVMLANVRPMTR